MSPTTSSPHQQDHDGSSTKPFPTTELEARCPGTANRKAEEGHDSHISARLGDLSLGARALVSSSDASCLLRPGAAENALSGESRRVIQSSGRAWFSLSWKPNVSCRFYYDASSDDLVLQNICTSPLQVRAAPMQNDGQSQILRLGDACIVSPGPWRVSLNDKIWADVILFSRRYVTERSAPAADVGQAGLKRTNDSLVAREPKRRAHILSTDKSGSDVLINSRPKGNEEMNAVTVSHPLLHLQSGQTVTIRSLMDGVPETDTAKVVSSENYSITHIRNIVATKDTCFIFRAHHSVFGCTAVKVIRSRKDEPVIPIPKNADTWQNEQRLMCKLRHPAIIKMFGSDARLYSIYMEYLPYLDLAQWRNSQSDHVFTGNIDDASRVLRGMASALAYLEKEGIIHNDIKPSNILYDRERGPILIDFGLACSFPPVDICLGGTPWYVAPEVLQEKVRGFASDVFALGVTLLYVLGKIPLPDATERSWIIWKVLGDHVEKQKMMNWLATVQKVRKGLARSGIEFVVESMLSQKLKGRMPAREVENGLK